MKYRLSLLLLVTTIPLVCVFIGILNMLAGYTDSYDAIMANLKIANEYNQKFQEEMEYSMYRVMIGLIDASEFEDGDLTEGVTPYAAVIKNPHNMIDSARYAFGMEIERIPGSDGDIKIRGILSCLDSLEKAVDQMIENSSRGSGYTENVSIWENDIQGLCSMIQNYITQYTYYEIMNMEDLQNELKVHIQQSMSSFIVLVIAALLLGLLLSAMITRSVTEPLNNLRKTAERLGRGDLTARADLCNLEEINVLTRTFNYMNNQIAELMERTRQEQMNLRETELKLYQEQVNPHFLYNTLDSIVWMAESGNNQQVVDMTMDLSDFFRTVLSGGKDFITVDEEEKHIRSYLKIQKIRYEDILDYSITMDPSIGQRKVLKMLLQPVVENALYHGIKNKRGGGKIVIRGYEKDGGLLFLVEDNGIGMDAAGLEALRQKLENETESAEDQEKGGFGMYNVAQRIRMHYGAESGITVESEKGMGTRVKIFLNFF